MNLYLLFYDLSFLVRGLSIELHYFTSCVCLGFGIESLIDATIWLLDARVNWENAALCKTTTTDTPRELKSCGLLSQGALKRILRYREWAEI